ncbi:MAG: histidinol phosphate phosphatase domain-containing protein [Nitrospirae bacterium]|nr:histidinol phosphate phosphatase domain-containing protein [Nitrospirota bacterium]
MIDLHTHTLLSDGVLLPSELIQRAYSFGYRAIALTDHVDSSNMDFVIPRISAAVKDMAAHFNIKVLAGAEITHVPPAMIGRMVERARGLGAQIVIVHGETIVEPVIAGTNAAGIEAGADIISHPGLISIDDARKAKENGVALEITARKGHSLSNGHVARTASKAGAKLVINTDSHAPDDLITKGFAWKVLRSAGIDEEDIDKVFNNSEELIKKYS